MHLQVTHDCASICDSIATYIDFLVSTIPTPPFVNDFAIFSHIKHCICENMAKIIHEWGCRDGRNKEVYIHSNTITDTSTIMRNPSLHI